MQIRRQVREVTATIQFCYDAEDADDVDWAKEMDTLPVNEWVRRIYERVKDIEFVEVSRRDEKGDE